MREKLESNSGVEHILHSEVESKLRKTLAKHRSLQLFHLNNVTSFDKVSILQ